MSDGGPAFPKPETLFHDANGFNMHDPAQYGMSLRDYFAGQALLAFVNQPGAANPERLAKWAFEQADAMLKAREETK